MTSLGDLSAETQEKRRRLHDEQEESFSGTEKGTHKGSGSGKGRRRWHAGGTVGAW